MTETTVRDVLSRFEGRRVLVVGDPILDEYVTGDCTRLSPEAPIPVLKVHGARLVLGGAANTAANVVALGGHATLVGAIGADEAGQRLTALARTHGIDTALVEDERASPRKVRALGGHQQLLRLDYEDDRPVSPGTAGAVLAGVREHLATASVVVVSDYAKGLVDVSFCQQVLALAREARVPVVIDPRPQHAEAYVGCEYLTPNWKEAQALLGDVEAAPSPAAIADVGRRLAGRFGAHVVLTLGSLGLRFFGRDGRALFDEPAQAREVFDVSGAGDTVVAAFALALAAGADVQVALRLANLAAGVVVAKLGTATVSRAEVLQASGADALVDGEVLAGRIREVRAAGRRIGVVTGVFETLHAVNLDQLRAVRRTVDLLVIGLHAGGGSDPRPRARVLSSLRDVDLVHVTDDPDGFVATIAPDVHLAEESAPVPRSVRP